MAADKEPVGFVGIGRMGWPMAANLVAAGFAVTVCDADPKRAERFVAEIGGAAARDTAALGAAVSLVVTMLPTGHEVRSVMLEDGLATALGAGGLLIDMSSADPIGTRALGAALAPHGVALVDAPVSGAVPRAIAGTLSIMIGADDPAAIARARPVLAAMGKSLYETGGLGSGHAMKALNNYVAAAGFAAACEALILGETFGLDPAVMVDILNSSTGRNFSTENTVKGEILTGSFASGFGLGLFAKDVGIAADLARGLALSAPLVAEVNALMAQARDAMGVDADHTRAIEAWRQRAGKGPSHCDR